MDSSQLYLLQAAFRSLESFFNLADTAATSSTAAAGDVNSSSPNAAAGRSMSKAVSSGDALAVAANIAKSVELRKNEEYVGDKGAIKEQSVPILSSGFEFDLAQTLLETQETLRKTRMRMGVLEMVQDEAMMGSSSALLEEDEEQYTLLGGNLSKDLVTESSVEEGREVVVTEEGETRPVDSERKQRNKLASFENILSEISALRACLSERASVDYPLGHLLDRNVAIVPLDDKTTTSTSYSSSTPTENSSEALPGVLRSMTDNTKDIIEIVKVKTQANTTNHTVSATLRQYEEKLAEYRLNAEQAEIAKNEFTSLTVELQILREKVLRQTKDENQLSMLTMKNIELTKHIKELEEQLGDNKIKRKETIENKNDNKKIHELKTINQQLELQKNTQLAEIERFQKENQRLRASMSISEERVKGSLQDQMTLHYQLQQYEEDNMNAKATITKLTREIEDYKINRGYREEADRRISELQREIHKRDVELAEAREEASQAVKFQTELNTAEKTIEQLEMNMGEMSVELEKGSVAMLQLDSYRDQLRVKTKENRDMSLHIHGLENQLKDVPYLQTRYAEVQEELEDCKMKIEKLPGLLSEQARLRGSSRASVKALQEHDKTLSHYKNRVKQLERETAILKNDNRAMQELEVKLKESNVEIKRLLTLISEGGASKSTGPGSSSGNSSNATAGMRGVSNASTLAEEERKKQASANEGQYRKMRTMIRQSIAMSGMTGTAGMAAAVAASMNHS